MPGVQIGSKSPPRLVIGRQNTWVSQAPIPEAIKTFLDHYKPSHYRCLAERAKKLIEEELEKPEWNDLHVKLTCREKNLKSLEEKLKMRHAETPYLSDKEIWDDIHDLAGVRIILYMSSDDQRKKVQHVIQNIWGKSVKPKYHPQTSERMKPEERAKLLQAPGEKKKLTKKKYKRRHLGYIAVHYRAIMKENHAKRGDYYSWTEGDKVEIQVVSALSHAWAEAGHDILYKSYAFGSPTVQEELLLDSLNGLIVSGDLLLEQFHELVRKRTTARFRHRDDLESFLRSLDILQPQDQSSEEQSCKKLDGGGHSNEEQYDQHSDEENCSEGECDEDESEEEDSRQGQFDEGRPEWQVEGLDVLLRFLKITGENFPLAVRDAIKELGFPEKPQLENIISTFEPAFEPAKGMLATICLIRHLLRERVHDPMRHFSPAEQCYVMMNALNLLQTLFGRAELTNKFLREDMEMAPDERDSLDYVLNEPCRQLALDRHNPNYENYQEKMRPYLKSAWDWFQNQATRPQSICGMVFRLAEMGATKDIEMQALLGQLSIGSIVSRSSTYSFEEEGGE